EEAERALRGGVEGRQAGDLGAEVVADVDLVGAGAAGDGVAAQVADDVVADVVAGEAVVQRRAPHAGNAGGAVLVDRVGGHDGDADVLEAADVDAAVQGPARPVEVQGDAAGARGARAGAGLGQLAEVQADLLGAGARGGVEG